MNALLGLLVVAAIGIFLCTILVVGGWLMRIILTRTEAVVSNSPFVSSRLLRDLQPMEDWLVDFISHSPELGDVLAVLAATDTSLPLARIVHKTRIGDGSPADSKIAANLVGAGLCILFMAGLVRLEGDGIVATDVGREVQRRINGAPHATYQPIQAAVVDQRTPATHAQEPSQIHEHGATSIEKTNNMNNRNIIMTAADHAELEAVIIVTGKVSGCAQAELKSLETELKRAEIVAPDEIPPDVITMNSRAELLDLESGERMELTLVLPADANINDGNISVLAPLGTAMLGYRVGDEFEWHVPYGLRRLKVINLRFQPEASLKKAA